MRFSQIIFLKGQMTSDRAENFFFITKQILLHNFYWPDFISNDFIFQAYFLKHFGWIWQIQAYFLKHFGYILADFVDAILADNFFEGSNDVRSGWNFFFITNQILLHNFYWSDFIFNDFIAFFSLTRFWIFWIHLMTNLNPG